VQINLNKLCYFWIPRVTPSNNIMLRMHHMARHKLNETWLWEIKAAIQDWEHIHREIPIAGWYVKRGVKIISCRHNMVDEDNLTGGIKPLLDAIMGNRLIWNDTPDCVALIVEQKINRKNPGTWIEISI